jgi:transposase InsO family protein
MHDHILNKHGVSVCPSVLYRFLKKRGLIRKPQKRQVWYTPMKEPYRASVPGENVQLDVKYVPGWDGSWRYQYRFIDAVTNIQYATDMDVKDARATILAFRRAIRSFPFPISGIQTDNGSEFRGVFHLYLLRCGIVHRYIPKRSAPWNGKVERANRSVDDEFYLNINRPWDTLREYTHWYNRERPHRGKSMNGMTPYQKFASLTSPQLSPLKGN